MTTVTTSYERPTATSSPRRRMLRRLIAGAAPFDAVMGVACVAAAGTIGHWLSIGTGTVRGTGVVFLAAAAAGFGTLLRSTLDARWVVAANAVFAAWCLAAIGFDRPGAVGVALLAASAACSAGTAVVEHRLGATA